MCIRDSYCGCSNATNNTGELTGMLNALMWAKNQGGHETFAIVYDSKYAKNITTGVWKPGKNAEIGQRCYEAFTAKNSRRRGGVEMIHVKGHSGNAGNDRADDRVQWGKESGPFCRFNVDGSNHEGDYINAPRPSPRPPSLSPSCVPPSPSLRLATSHPKCMKCKTRPKARRALFTPSTPQPIAISYQARRNTMEG